MVYAQNNILIIEDSEVCRTILKKAFRNDFGILEASDGSEGLQILKQTPANIIAIFLDLVMPNVDGFQVLHDLQNNDLLHKTPIFLITAEADNATIEHAYSNGVIDVILKPFNIPLIKQRVMNIIELYNNRNQLETLFNESQNVIFSQDEELSKTNTKLIELLGNAVESRSTETGSHVRRIKLITEILVRTLSVKCPGYGLSEKKIQAIIQASVLHDIGKIAIPDSILNKPASMGRLTPDEFEIMKTHTTAGCKMLEPIKDNPLYQYYYDICRFHHERWDGKGYPDGLKRNDIPISAQIVAIADVYDALICKRVYKPAFAPETAIAMINNGDCGQFNPDILDSFNNQVTKIYDEIYKTNFDNATFTL